MQRSEAGEFTEEEIEMFKNIGEIKCCGVRCKNCEAYVPFESVCSIVLCHDVAYRWRNKHGQYNNDQA